MPLPNIRLTNIIIFIGCVGLILIALGFQEIMGLAPCPLCITQRIFVVAVGLFALAAAIHNPGLGGRRLYALGGIAMAITGAGFSGRHLYLQGLPADQLPSCGPGLSYMFETFPFMEAMEILLMGDGNCGDVMWSLFGISMPGWVLVAFIGLALFNVWQLLRRG
ncbi:MAG: disulfide bond formation protein B [Cellvibrionaceae bacterium]|nr:disulfide bond formation protein B [Cellvibrionaceae bacterium]